MTAPLTIVSCHVPRFTVAPGATLEQFLAAWARSYVVARSWPIDASPPAPPRLRERERAQIEDALNRDLEGAGRPERVDVAADLGENERGDLVLSWKRREPAPADAAPSPEEMAREVERTKGPSTFTSERYAGFLAGVAAERARAAAREQELAAEVERLALEQASNALADAHVFLRAWWDATNTHDEDENARRALAVLEEANGTTVPTDSYAVRLERARADAAEAEVERLRKALAHYTSRPILPED